MNKSISYLLITLLILFQHTSIAQNNNSTSQEKGKYEGKIKFGDQRHGEGTYTWPDGTVYSGRWKYDLMDGEGKMTFPNGSYYRGAWKEGQKHGYGTFKWTNGDSYVGWWRFGKKHGFGTLKLKDGTIHKGEWVNDVANGEGKHTWANGSQYEGDWKNGKMDGQGIMMYPDGDIKLGTWSKGEHLPCHCENLSFPTEKAYKTADAVFIGVVTTILPQGELYLAKFEVLKYWKGKLTEGRSFYVQAAYTSCDIFYEEGESYLIYASQNAYGGYETSTCSRSNKISKVKYDLDILNKLVPCTGINSNNNVDFHSNYDPVCGCDGNTYKNAYKAYKNNILQWEIGACETAQE